MLLKRARSLTNHDMVGGSLALGSVQKGGSIDIPYEQSSPGGCYVHPRWSDSDEV